VSDIICRVCGEPWDSYGVHHGDMTRWQAKLLLRGAGCACCEGISPYADRTPTERLAVADSPDPEDVLVEQHARSLGRAVMEVPEWEQPDPELLWVCKGCGVEVVQDPETDFPAGNLDENSNGELAWSGGQRWHYQGGISYSYGEAYGDSLPSVRPDILVGTDCYCPGCVKACPDCGEAFIAGHSRLEEEFPSYLVDDDDFHRCRAVCESCYFDWQNEQEEEQDFDADEEDDSSDWEEDDE
jgi:hypothetical protein